MAINPQLYIHESDRNALAALKAIPGFSALLKTFMSIWNESQLRIQNMSSNLRLGENQLSKYYDMLPPICEKLGIEVPELYLKLDVCPNAYTYGDTKPFIVITSGLLETLPDELIPSVLAHECGHIACHHALYTTMGSMILQGIAELPGLASLVSLPVQVAFYYWMRCSELSADRAAAVYNGNADDVIEMCMRFAGYDKDIQAEASKELFMTQALEYKEMIQNSNWNKTLEFLMLSNADHPFSAVRAYECDEWVKSEQFQQIICGELTDCASTSDLDFAIEYIQMPFDLKHYVGMNYQESVLLLEALGFTNVTLLPTRKKGLLTKAGQVLKITLNSQTDIKPQTMQPCDAEIVVTWYDPTLPPEPNEKAGQKDKR